MQTEVRAIVTSLLMLTIIACAANRGPLTGNRVLQQNIEEYQRALIAKGVTGGSVAGVSNETRRGRRSLFETVNMSIRE